MTMIDFVSPLRVLFVCTGNSCRSQMAEAWARRLQSQYIEPYSAGVQAHGLNRVAVRVMAEAGIDIAHYRSKKIAVLKNVVFDYVVTVCDEPKCQALLFPEYTRVLRAAFDDPTALARTAATEEEAIDHYRRVRDQIRQYIGNLPETIAQLKSSRVR